MTFKTHRQIISAWPSVPDLARDIKEDYQKVWRWYDRNSIPDNKWKKVLKAAKKRDIPLTAEILINIAAKKESKK